MQLNEILEENSVKSISQKTKISEDNLENLLARNFNVLMKTKTLGFISILEREYKADLTALKEEALEYYASNQEDHAFSVAVPMEEEKKGKSKLFLLIVLILLGYASWYFFTQFDKQHLRTLIPFIDTQMVESANETVEGEMKQDIPLEDLSIENAVASNTKIVSEITEEKVEESSAQESNQSTIEMIEEINTTTTSVNQF
jgi:cytoskeletal protein RodZ